MKVLKYFVCFILVLLMAAVPVAATTTTYPNLADSITTVSPSVAQTGNTVSVTITGVNFTSTQGSVRLEMEDESDIDATITSWTPVQIKCKFVIKSNKEPGLWDVVVVKGIDDSVIVKTNGFAISEEMSVTSVTPASGQVDDEVDFTITGSGFDEDFINDVFLSLDDFDENISADEYDVTSKTKITGTFDLDGVDEDTYDICIEDDYGAVECKKNAFEVTTNAEGSIDIASNPSGATIYIDDVANGTTPRSVDILVGSHKVTLKKAGYQDWGKIVNVEEDETTEIDATLYQSATATPTHTESTPRPTTAPTTVRTTMKTTIKVPTTWADTPTTTPASPVEPAVVIGTLCAAFVILKKR